MSLDLSALRLFEEALDVDVEGRSEFLDQACRGEPQLREEVESLLNAFAEPDALLPEPDERETPHFEAGSVLADRYMIVELLGVGGMGEVYRADDSHLSREVAIKLVRRNSLRDLGIRERFHREAKSVAALSHPNIVTLYDLASISDTQFAVMEFVNGKTLREHIELGLPLEKAVAIIGEIAAGLSSAHSLGVMHRDIKPENVIITQDGQAKILDFGIARPADLPQSQELTARDAMAPGTLPYMSPEQVEGEALSSATDIFSLGTVFSEAITGISPFRAGTALQTMRNVAEVNPIQQFAWPEDTPASIVELVTSMWARRPEDRPSAADVVVQLGEWLSDLGHNAAGTVRPASGPTARDAGARTNLPARPLDITGRDEEIARVIEGLREHPLSTIVGPGGAGKTSLAVETARRVLSEYPGGVWLCEFATETSAATLSEVLASSIDGARGTSSGLDQVIARLREQPTLLLFDNCEHVVEAVAELAESLLRAAPDLTILATSRESLDIVGEHTVRIEGLSCSGVDSSAVELFVRRTSAPGIAWDAAQKQLVEQIVGRLEGLPLAIEIAASQLSAMSLAELLEALDDQMETLQSARRFRGRQATVSRTVAWSFALLAPDEQRLLLSLSVFAGRFTAEAAARIAGGAAGIRRLLQRLVDQSMLVRTEVSEESRFRLLEPIRQFCQSRVEPAPLRELRKRHAQVFAERATSLGRGIYGDHEEHCNQWLGAEWPDLRKAVAWGRENGVVEIAIDPVVALDRTVWFQVRVEAYEWLSLAEHQFAEVIASRADALAMLATAQWVAGNAQGAAAYLERSLAMGPTSSGLYLRYMTLLVNPATQGEAIAVVHQARRLADEQHDRYGERWWRLPLIALALAASEPNDPRVDEDIATAKSHLDRLYWPTGNAMLAMVFGGVARGRGDNAGAIEHYNQAIQWARAGGNRAIEAVVGMTLGGLAQAQGSARQPLESAVDNLRLLIEAGSESGEASLYPLAVQSLIIALANCECWEAAARCSGLLPKLAGVGHQDATGPGYTEAIDRVAENLGANRLEALQLAGAQAAPSDLIEWAEQSLAALHQPAAGE